MTIISDYVAFEMREQLLLTQMFYELKGLTEIPLSFADCRFYINKHKNGGLVDLKDLLKKWVSNLHGLQILSIATGTSVPYLNQ